MEFFIQVHCVAGGVLTAAAVVRTPLDTADGPADNKTQGCRSDHYFSQDLNQGGENDPPRSKVSNRLALTDWCTDL